MANFVLTQQYDSSSESDNNMEIDQRDTERKQTSRCQYDWIKDQSFSDDEQAQVTIKEEKLWSRYYSNKSNDGIKVHYRCNQVKFRGKQCDAAVYLHYPHDSDKVVLFRTKNEHTHTDAETRRIFPQEVKERIEELFDLKLKPKKIYEMLQEKNFKVTRTQLNNYLTQLRKTKLGPSTLSLGQLESVCEEKSIVPQSDDEPFVVSFIIKYEDDIDDDQDVEDSGNKCRFFISTKRLLKFSSVSTILHADATYKLNWQGFLVLIMGTSDFDRKLHPLGLAVCSDEQQPDFEFIFKSIFDGVEKFTEWKFTPSVLVADGSGAIRNAFAQVFNNNKMVMCWAHMRRNVVKRLKGINNEVKNEILEDIDKLQLSESETVFISASSLFMKKWRTREEDFSEYFENVWLISLSSWYERYNKFTPSTNNALEATNRVIKDEHTFRERHTLSRFFTIANEIVKTWSKSRNHNLADPVVFSMEPSITLKKWTDAYHFAKSSKSVFQIQSKRRGFTEYYIPAGDKENVTKNEIQRYKRKKWTSFDQFKDLQYAIWKVTLSDNPSEWQHGICNCPSFSKEYICKHIIGMAIRLKFCKPPPAAKDIPLGEKRKRGRPRKATQALLIQ